MSQKKVKQQRRELRRQNREIRGALAEQLRLLEKRCRDFDGGDWGEAVDISARLRVIFHPGNPSKHPSILQSLEAGKVPVLSTVEPVEDTPNVIASPGGLYSQRVSNDENGVSYSFMPLFAGAYGSGPYSYRDTVPANRWWDQVVEIKGDEVGNPGRHVYRRKDVVTGIANKDGGAHLAKTIPDSYDVLSRPGGLITIHIGEEGNPQEVPVVGIHLAMLRQIAYEALNSPALRELADPDKG